MNKLTPFLIAAVCSLTFFGTACSPVASGTDAGPTIVTDAGPTTIMDGGMPVMDGGPVSTDAGPNCDGGSCYACTPTNYAQLVNHCTDAQGIAKSPVLPYVGDGGLPALP